jgi:hypothetical protein
MQLWFGNWLHPAVEHAMESEIGIGKKMGGIKMGSRYLDDIFLPIIFLPCVAYGTSSKLEAPNALGQSGLSMAMEVSHGTVSSSAFMSAKGYCVG